MAEDKRLSSPAESLPAWRVAGKSVRGAAHLRSGLPNQDAIGWLPAAGEGVPLALAVSDGHGSAKSFRSDRGARFAVEAVLKEFSSLVEHPASPGIGPERADAGAAAELSAIKRMAESHLPQLLVRRWVLAVQSDLEKEPFAASELEGVEKRDGQKAREKVEGQPLLAYGATVLAALVGHSYLVYLQLGDGDILAVSDEGTVTRPFEKDARLFANETTSLCSPSAEGELRVLFQPLNGPSTTPALILVSTDGYANSFRDEAGFLQVGSDIYEMTRADGWQEVCAEMETWLGDASQIGSGDDITLGLLARRPAPPLGEGAR